MWAQTPEIFSSYQLPRFSFEVDKPPSTAIEQGAMLRTALSQMSLGTASTSTISDNSDTMSLSDVGIQGSVSILSSPNSPTFSPSVVAGALGRVSRKVLTSIGANTPVVGVVAARRRAMSASAAITSGTHTVSLSDDEFLLAPAGPVTIRRSNTLESTRASGVIMNNNSGNCNIMNNNYDKNYNHSSNSYYNGKPVMSTLEEDIFSDSLKSNFTRLEDLKLLNGSSTSISGSEAYSSSQPICVPEVLKVGVSLFRITHRKKVQKIFRLDPDTGTVSWDVKKTSSTQFSIDKIFEIRIGNEAKNYREEFKISPQLCSRWASIIYTKKDGNQLKALHLVGTSQNEFDMFIDTLKRLMTYRRQIMSGLAMPGESFVSAHWDRYVIRDSGEERVSFESVEKLARRLHINCSRVFLLQQFERADVDKSGYLNFTEFQQFVRFLKYRQEIVSIYEQVVGADNIPMNFSDFKKFFYEVQKETSIPDNMLTRVFDKYSSDGLTLNREEFSDLLISSYLFPALSQESEDLTRPLNEYFISSSHNTYLLGRQVAGPSSLEAYTRALQNGCRCIEIDCWDSDHGPIVCHGHRFTSSIDFADVINIIRKYGFIASPYPLILSLEVHCNSENQKIMVDKMKSILEDFLVQRPLMNNYHTLPSPEELKYRILVKVKVSQSSPSSLYSNTWSSENTVSSATTSTTTTTVTTDTFSSFSDDGFKKPSAKPKKKRHILQTKIIPELGELGVYTSGVKFRNFSLPASKTINHIFSLSERTINSMIKDKDKNSQLLKHNRRFLMRVYPAAYRVRSTNFDPIPYWKRGIQMVALNWQTNDIGMQFNEALFGNGGGYVLKPSGLQNSISRFLQHTSSNSLRTVHPSSSGSLNIKISIISAQQLPRPSFMKPDESFDPLVCIELYGDPGKVSDIDKKNEIKEPPVIAVSRWKTHSVIDNGFNPIWNSEWQVNVNRDNYQFTFVRFGMQCQDTTFAVYTVRLCKLNQGYRHLQLRDIHGEEYIFSTLFIKTEITQ